MNNLITITLPDGSQREYPSGSSSLDVALSISEGLARNVLAAKVNGKVQDANLPIEADATLQLLTWNDPRGKGNPLALVGARAGGGRGGVVSWYKIWDWPSH